MHPISSPTTQMTLSKIIFTHQPWEEEFHYHRRISAIIRDYIAASFHWILRAVSWNVTQFRRKEESLWCKISSDRCFSAPLHQPSSHFDHSFCSLAQFYFNTRFRPAGAPTVTLRLPSPTLPPAATRDVRGLLRPINPNRRRASARAILSPHSGARRLPQRYNILPAECGRPSKLGGWRTKEEMHYIGRYTRRDCVAWRITRRRMKAQAGEAEITASGWK